MVTSGKQPIPHAGGKLRIIPGPNHSYQLEFSHTSSTHGMAFYQVAVSHSGTPLAFIPASGLGSPGPPRPQPSILAFIISDAQEMWGRICPQCRSYFRTNHIAGMTVCPYCTFAYDGLSFMPETHLRYLKKFVQAVQQVVAENREIEIDLDEATDHSEWTYNERQLQHRFDCAICHVSTDILGEYGSCPSCGKRNSGGIFHRKINEIEAELKKAEAAQRADLLNRVVSVFEAMANDLKRVLASIPCHPNRREQVARLNFQNLAAVVDQLQQWYAFDLRKGLLPDELAFVDLMFRRRHLFTHNAGRVDEKYLREAGDTSFELNELVVLTGADMDRLLPALRKLGSNLISDVEAIEAVLFER